MQEVLFILLRLGLKNTVVSEEEYNCVKRLSVQQWKELITLSLRHGVAAIAVDGVQQLYENYESLMKEPELRNLKMKWYTHVIFLETRNRQQITQMKQMGQMWSYNECRMLLMKGQANGLYFPNPLHRETGDVDCYLFENYDKGNQLATAVGAKINADWYKHSQIGFNGEIFENHQYFVHTREGKRSKRLNQTLCQLLQEEELTCYPDSSILLPPVMFNALFLTYHGFAHFISEGIRLKQVLDWAMFLKMEQYNIVWDELYLLCEKFKLKRYLIAMNTIAVRYLGVKITNPDVLIESPYAERIFRSVLYDDDYVFSSGEGSWRNRLHIITNLFKYRWKYHEIYQENVLKQLYYYVFGYFFHTE